MSINKKLPPSVENLAQPLKDETLGQFLLLMKYILPTVYCKIVRAKWRTRNNQRLSLTIM